MRRELLKLNRKSRWTLRKEIKTREEKLRLSDPTTDDYKATLNSIEQVTRIRNSKTEARVKVLKDVGTLAILAAVAVVGYKIDKSDSIPRNKTSMNLFNKVFRF